VRGRSRAVDSFDKRGRTSLVFIVMTRSHESCRHPIDTCSSHDALPIPTPHHTLARALAIQPWHASLRHVVRRARVRMKRPPVPVSPRSPQEARATRETTRLSDVAHRRQLLRSRLRW
jgi:hypothetical protein